MIGPTPILTLVALPTLLSAVDAVAVRSAVGAGAWARVKYCVGSLTAQLVRPRHTARPSRRRTISRWTFIWRRRSVGGARRSGRPGSARGNPPASAGRRRRPEAPSSSATARTPGATPDPAYDRRPRG